MRARWADVQSLMTDPIRGVNEDQSPASNAVDIVKETPAKLPIDLHTKG
jgi:hypothetical protein